MQMQAGLDGFLAIAKYLLVKRGLFTSAARRPPYAWSLDPESAAEVDRLFERLQSSVRQVGAAQAGDSGPSNCAI
jgi:4-hydroxy-tetrahydrodipicolinate synthase